MQTAGFRKTKLLRKIKLCCCLSLIIMLTLLESTSSFYLDSEPTQIALKSETLAIKLRSEQPDFSSTISTTSLVPNSQLKRDIYLKKIGSLPFYYGITVSQDHTCDTALLAELELQVFYNFYHTQTLEDPLVSQSLSTNRIYQGKLADFALNTTALKLTELQIPNEHPYFPNNLYQEDEHWLSFQLNLPTNPAPTLQNKNCEFSLNFKARQLMNSSGGVGFSDLASLTSSVNTDTWLAPEKAEDYILINEFITDPAGNDVAPKPAGEWVELYNSSKTNTFELAGWVLTDQDNSHQLLISSSKTLSGNTAIGPQDYLVIYRNSDADFNLNQNIDKLQLFNGDPSSAILVDSYHYTIKAPQEISWQRVPDGAATWEMANPTKGSANQSNNSPVLNEQKAETNSTIKEPLYLQSPLKLKPNLTTEQSSASLLNSSSDSNLTQTEADLIQPISNNSSSAPSPQTIEKERPLQQSKQ